MQQSGKVFLGSDGEFLLYEVVRNGEVIVSIQNRNGAEMMSAKNEKRAIEWCSIHRSVEREKKE